MTFQPHDPTGSGEPRSGSDAQGSVTVDLEIASKMIALSRNVVTVDGSNFADGLFSRCVDALQTVHGRRAISARELPFNFLRTCFPADFLDSVNVISTPAVPEFPWMSIAMTPRPIHEPLPENVLRNGLSLRDAYLIRSEQMESGQAHLLQLVQVAQWRVLGDEAYLWTAAAAHVRRDVEVSPLLSMAQRIAERVTSGGDIPVLDLVRHEFTLLGSSES